MSDFFLSLPLERWRAFAEGRPAVRCSPGHLIYLQDTEATCFYYLKKGRVKSFIQSADGAERVLNLYRAGSLFGEASFFDELPRVSSAIALTPCELVPIDRELVTQAVATDPELAMSMLKYLARTVRLLSGQLDDMAFRPVPWRLARFQLSYADQSSLVRCTQEEIASSISASRVTVSRALNQFARKGLLTLGYGEIRIRNPDGLKRLCGDGA
mgnify:FL=1